MQLDWSQVVIRTKGLFVLSLHEFFGLILPVLGYAVGMFCAIAVNDGSHGMNVREWFPNWISCLVYVICPFVDIVRPLGIANGLVPLLNAFYWLLVYLFLNSILVSSTKIPFKIK
jgi:hypothetical protein